MPKKKRRNKNQKAKVEFGLFPAANGKFVLTPLNEHTFDKMQTDRNLQGFVQQMEDFGGDDHGQDANEGDDMPFINDKEIREVDEYGFPNDGYDYYQHLAPIDGRGTFIAANGRILSNEAANESRGKKTGIVLKDDLKESGVGDDNDEEEQEYEQDDFNQKKLNFEEFMDQLDGEEEEKHKNGSPILESIVLRNDIMDRDLLIALGEESGGEDGDSYNYYDEQNIIDDDFMNQLISAPVEEKDEKKFQDISRRVAPKKKKEIDFDYEAHIADLLNEARMEDGEFDFDEYLLEEIIEDEGVKYTGDLDEAFDEFMKDYYVDEEIGELDEADFDERVAGYMDESNLRVEALISEFVEQKMKELEDGEKAMSTSKHLKNEILARYANYMNKAEQDQTEDEKKLENYAGGYNLMQRKEVEHDCATIVSTYSTLDNHPSMIFNKKKSKPSKYEKRKLAMLEKKNNPIPEEEEEEEEVQFTDVAQVSKTRKRGETKEEKRARKQAVKAAKAARRAEKKQSKNTFKKEHLKQSRAFQNNTNSGVRPGVSTFKL